MCTFTIWTRRFLGHGKDEGMERWGDWATVSTYDFIQGQPKLLATIEYPVSQTRACGVRPKLLSKML